MSKELGTLVIVVLKAQHLIDNHTFYKQDPYAKLSLSGATKQTPVDPKGGQHPVWDVELRFPISRDPSKSNRTLVISVFSEEKKDDELLGEGTIDITDTLKSGEFDGAPTFSLASCCGLNTVIDWVPLSLKGTQRGDVYLEMTFFAAGPAPLTRRPSKFTNPAERLARLQQLISQRPQRVVSQPLPSLLTPGGQGSWTDSHEGPRQGRSKVQQVPLPGPWPGQSVQQHQQAQPAAPSHLNRRSSKSEDGPLPPLPQDAEPNGESVPSILRPGGPSRTPMHPIHELFIRTFYRSPVRLHRPISRLRYRRSHMHTRSLLIRRKGPRNMSDSRQVDIQLRSLPLKHSLNFLMLNIILNHKHRHSNGNKFNIALGSKRSLH